MKTRVLKLLTGLAFAVVLHAGGSVREIQDLFFAPCCWHESLAVHDSPVAAELRTEVAQLVAAGQSEREIVELLTARYGERILQHPRGPLSVVLSVIPWITLALGFGALLLYLRRARRLPAPALTGAPAVQLPEDWDLHT
jgi:cytochrome c-type biogenesis protein CcmH